jgi:hypothetical protein
VGGTSRGHPDLVSHRYLFVSVRQRGPKYGLSMSMRSGRLFLTLALTCCGDAFAYDPVDCVNDIAEADPGIAAGLAARLCSGSWTREPLRCYALVLTVDKEIPRFIAIDLCAGALDGEKTVDCYAKAGARLKMNRGLATTLCGAKKIEK